MNQVDLAIVVVTALGAIYGLLRGVLRMTTSIVALAAGLYVAENYYTQVAGIAEHRFDLGPTAAAAVGYVVMFALSFVIVGAIGEVFGRLVRIVRLGWVDSIGGAAVGVAVSGALVGLFLMFLTAILPVDAEVLRQSQLAPVMLRYAEILIAYVPEEVKDAYRLKRDELLRLWHEGAPSASPTPGTK